MKIVFVDSILTLDQAQWNRLCAVDYPFVRYEFLAALEATGCTSAQSGWQPHHLLLLENDQLVGAVPGYIKTHSYGEYVFDWAWAEAYERYGYSYFPKWICAIPFTPCYGPRLLGRAAALGEDQLLELVRQESARLNLSGWHILFPSAQVSKQMLEAGCAQRLGCQFHWHNRAYKTFDDFLATMNSRKRKNIIKERRAITAQGIAFEWLEGAQITRESCDNFYQFYRDTYLRRSGHNGYLTQAFFQRLSEAMPNNILIVNAFIKRESGQHHPIAAALFFKDSTTLYGRYWGCLDDYKFLHFETCYYQGIDFSIARGLTRFDGGAQGEHKIARGFEPEITYSNHWLADERFQDAIANAVAAEAEDVLRYKSEVQASLPFKQFTHDSV